VDIFFGKGCHILPTPLLASQFLTKPGTDCRNWVILALTRTAQLSTAQIADLQNNELNKEWISSSKRG
jgi:hypothetical protein